MKCKVFGCQNDADENALVFDRRDPGADRVRWDSLPKSGFCPEHLRQRSVRMSECFEVEINGRTTVGTGAAGGIPEVAE